MKALAIAVCGIAALVLVAIVLLFGWPWSGRDVAPGVTPAVVRALRLGMSRAEIEAVIGSPLAVEVEPSGAELWLLSRPVERVWSFPSIVLRISAGALQDVYVEQKVFWGVDEEPLYSLTARGLFEAPAFANEHW